MEEFVFKYRCHSTLSTSCYFSNVLTEVVVRRKFCKCLHCNLWKFIMETSVVVTSFINDESVPPPTLLKMESTTDILIDQVKKFQKAATALQRAFCLSTSQLQGVLGNMLKIASFKNRTSREAHRNTECINLRFQFAKFRPFRCFTLCLNYTGLCTGH